MNKNASHNNTQKNERLAIKNSSKDQENWSVNLGVLVWWEAELLLHRVILLLGKLSMRKVE
jgi:hypothetical protein